jgi:CRISPR-associated protein Cmr4
LGIIDLPIQRERHTSFPKIEGSSLKGAVRSAVEFKVLNAVLSAENLADPILDNLVKVNKVFGFDGSPIGGYTAEKLEEKFKKPKEDNVPLADGSEKKETELKTEFAGAIALTDARLLLFPIKSMKGVFAWATCPKVLKKFASDLKLCGIAEESLPQTPSKLKNTCLPSSNEIVVNKNYVILEEYTFETGNTKPAEDWAKKIQDFTGIEELTDKLVILPDDDFRDFVNLSTEVITRTKINNHTGTVQDGALFTEEYLPAESVMYSVAMAHDEFAKDGMKANGKGGVMDFFDENLPKTIQIGGSATLGKGLVNISFNPNSKENA